MANKQDRTSRPLGDLAKAAASPRAAKPVHLWNPPYSGEIDMQIAADGTWNYLGSPIRRQAMVELFASILRREADGRYYLVTPVEKFVIRVDDAPFIAASMDVKGEGRGQAVTFHTNAGDSVTAGPEHALRFEREAVADGLKPYVMVRPGLEALLSRSLVFDLADLICDDDSGGQRAAGIWSGAMFFAIGPAGDQAGP